MADSNSIKTEVDLFGSGELERGFLSRTFKKNDQLSIKDVFKGFEQSIGPRGDLSASANVLASMEVSMKQMGLIEEASPAPQPK